MSNLKVLVLDHGKIDSPEKETPRVGRTTAWLLSNNHVEAEFLSEIEGDLAAKIREYSVVVAEVLDENGDLWGLGCNALREAVSAGVARVIMSSYKKPVLERKAEEDREFLSLFLNSVVYEGRGIFAVIDAIEEAVKTQTT
ncbi:MAG: hypothetical protein ABII07_03785 [Patescibacteria group bacterium]|nr:hypothetical protein [Patescibacteria group bacterium]